MTYEEQLPEMKRLDREHYQQVLDRCNDDMRFNNSPMVLNHIHETRNDAIDRLAWANDPNSN